MNDTDQLEEYTRDATDTENLSECCGANVILETFCADCKEHCR